MKNKGFSLVELIVVVAIMAVLAGVAVPVYSHFVEEAKKKADNDYVAEVYRLACIEAQTHGLVVDKIAVALEDDNVETTPDYEGRLARVIFVGETENNRDSFRDAEVAIILAVWDMIEPRVFEHADYLSWIPQNGVQGVEYRMDTERVSEYPYLIQGYQKDPDAPDQSGNNEIELPSINI